MEAKRNKFITKFKRFSNFEIVYNFLRCGGGEIRTRDTLAGIHAFQACAIDH